MKIILYHNSRIDHHRGQLQSREHRYVGLKGVHEIQKRMINQHHAYVYYYDNACVNWRNDRRSYRTVTWWSALLCKTEVGSPSYSCTCRTCNTPDVSFIQKCWTEFGQWQIFKTEMKEETLANVDAKSPNSVEAVDINRRSCQDDCTKSWFVTLRFDWSSQTFGCWNSVKNEVYKLVLLPHFPFEEESHARDHSASCPTVVEKSFKRRSKFTTGSPCRQWGTQNLYHASDERNQNSDRNRITRYDEIVQRSPDDDQNGRCCKNTNLLLPASGIWDVSLLSKIQILFTIHSKKPVVLHRCTTLAVGTKSSKFFFNDAITTVTMKGNMEKAKRLDRG